MTKSKQSAATLSKLLKVTACEGTQNAPSIRKHQSRMSFCKD